MLYEVVWASGKANEATKARKKEMRGQECKRSSERKRDKMEGGGVRRHIRCVHEWLVR